MPYFVLTLAGASSSDLARVVLPDDLGVEPFELTVGRPVLGRVAAKPVLAFDPERPEARKLADLQPNTAMLFPVSPRLRDLLAVEPGVEFLPVALADHRGKVVRDDYFLANFLEPVDCVDASRSVIRMGNVIKTQASRIKKLVVDERKVPPGRRAFRLTVRTTTVLVDAPLAQALQAAALTGVGLVPLEGFDSNFHVGV